MLRAVDYGEADRVVTLLGRSTGCVGAMARGARKSQRRFGGGLGLCSRGEAVMRERGGAELLTLETFEVAKSYPSLGSDVERMGHAAYAAELVTKLCAPRQAEPGIFDLMTVFLDGLETDGVHEMRLRIFELGLLERLGFAPALEACAVCGRRDLSTGDNIDVRFLPDQGGVVCRGCASRGRPMRSSVRLALAALARTGLDRSETPPDGPGGASRGFPVLPPDVARGCREALHELIAGHLSAPLRSLDFLAKTESARALAARGTS